MLPQPDWSITLDDERTELRERVAAFERLEQSLRDRERQLRDAEEIARLGTYIYTFATGTWTSTSKLDALFGIEAAATRNVDLWVSLVHPDDRDRMAAYLESVYRNRHRFEAEYRIVRRNDRAVRDVIGLGDLEFDARGEPVRMLGTIQDVTALKRGAEARRARDAEYRRLFETMIQGVVYQDASGRIVSANPAAERILGLTLDQMAGRTNLDPRWRAIHDDGSDFPGDTHPAIEALRTGREVRDVVMGVFNPTLDEYTWINVCAVPLFHNGDRAPYQVYATLEDITERRRAEEHRRRMDTEFQRAQRMERLGRVAGGIAHDFNNLLTAILGHVNLARMACADPQVVRDLADAEHACQHAVGLTHQLLTFARGGAPVTQVVAAAPLLRGAAQACVRGTGVRLIFDVPDRLAVNVDPAQIRQVVHNLCTNACQAMPGGGTLTLSATEAAAGGNRVIRVRVADTGVGIPADVQGRIFEPYFTTRTSGVGLGLAVAYSVIRRHGGTISVESTAGLGTTFLFDLPAAPLPSEGVPAALAAPVVAASARVLVMDDEDVVRTLLTRMLQREGHVVVGVKDGQAAIDTYRDARAAGAPFEMVFLDLTVKGGMGGVEAVRGILACDPHARVVVSSGYCDDPVLASHRRYGFSATLAKPYRLDELQGVLREVLKARVPATSGAGA